MKGGSSELWGKLLLGWEGVRGKTRGRGMGSSLFHVFGYVCFGDYCASILIVVKINDQSTENDAIITTQRMEGDISSSPGFCIPSPNKQAPVTEAQATEHVQLENGEDYLFSDDDDLPIESLRLEDDEDVLSELDTTYQDGYVGTKPVGVDDIESDLEEPLSDDSEEMILEEDAVTPPYCRMVSPAGIHYVDFGENEEMVPSSPLNDMEEFITADLAMNTDEYSYIDNLRIVDTPNLVGAGTREDQESYVPRRISQMRVNENTANSPPSQFDHQQEIMRPASLDLPTPVYTNMSSHLHSNIWPTDDAGGDPRVRPENYSLDEEDDMFEMELNEGMDEDVLSAGLGAEDDDELWLFEECTEMSGYV
jgi:hypothetical protein